MNIQPGSEPTRPTDTEMQARLDTTQPTCWMCHGHGGVAEPLDAVINVDNALEFFHGDCAEEFLDSMAIASHGGE